MDMNTKKHGSDGLFSDGITTEDAQKLRTFIIYSRTEKEAGN